MGTERSIEGLKFWLNILLGRAREDAGRFIEG